MMKTPEEIQADLERDSREWGMLGFVLIVSCVFVLGLGVLMR